MKQALVKLFLCVSTSVYINHVTKLYRVTCFPYCTTKGKQRALSRNVTCNFRLYLRIGWTSVKLR